MGINLDMDMIVFLIYAFAPPVYFTLGYLP